MTLFGCATILNNSFLYHRVDLDNVNLNGANLDDIPLKNTELCRAIAPDGEPYPCTHEFS